MAGSIYDKINLPEDVYNTVVDLGEKWTEAQTPEEKEQIHRQTELLRQEYGYSGGAAGDEFLQVERTAPSAPETRQYERPYEELQTEQLSKILEYPDFDYDPKEDPSYQAFVRQATRKGNEAFQNNLAQISAATGGRPSSWAGTVASRAREDYALQASEAVGQFEQMAYEKYRDQRDHQFNVFEAVNYMDDKEYARYQDSINQAWKEYEAEYDKYAAEIDSRQRKIQNAYDRTELTGYVSNEDAATLGVEPGTPSADVRQRAEELLDYEERLKIQTEYEKDSLAYELAQRNRYASPSGGGGGGGSYTEESPEGEITEEDKSAAKEDLTQGQWNEAKRIAEDYREIFSDENNDWRRASDSEKREMVVEWWDQLITDYKAGAYKTGQLFLIEDLLADHPTMKYLEPPADNSMMPYFDEHGNYIRPSISGPLPVTTRGNRPSANEDYNEQPGAEWMKNTPFR